jgi:hypothetical protein
VIKGIRVRRNRKLVRRNLERGGGAVAMWGRGLTAANGFVGM